MKFANIKIESYCISNSTDVPDYLIELERETNLTKLTPQMLSGRLQGRILSLLSKLINPNKILEVGTFTGYSALCLVEGLQENGQLITIENKIEHKDIIEKYFEKSGYYDRIKLVIDDAKKVLTNLNDTFDLVFLDAHKEDYQFYYDSVLPNVNSGGVIIVDNVLWSGKVINELNDRTAASIDDFNKYVLEDSRTENIMIPIRDGINIIRKK